MLRLDRRAFGPRFLLRDAAEHLFGLFERGADAVAFLRRAARESDHGSHPLARANSSSRIEGSEVARRGSASAAEQGSSRTSETSAATRSTLPCEAPGAILPFHIRGWAIHSPEVSEYDHWLALRALDAGGHPRRPGWHTDPVHDDAGGRAPRPRARHSDRRSRCFAGHDGSRLSGRPRESLEGLFGGAAICCSSRSTADGAATRAPGSPWAEASQEEVEDLAEELRGLATRHPGARVGRKTWSVAFHFRAIHRTPRGRRGRGRGSRRRLAHGPLALRRRPRVGGVGSAAGALEKGSAIEWLRERAGTGARLLALGDDVTDEDMFRSLAAEDESVLVSNEAGRATAARWRLEAPEETERLLRWILAVRRSATDSEAFAPPRRIEMPRIDLD